MRMIPPGFEVSRLAPSMRELAWIFDRVKEIGPRRVLEFGCGVTTWVIREAWAPEMYVAVEVYEPSIAQVRRFVPEVSVLGAWEDIPRVKFDLVFVDSSAGVPGGAKGLHRGKAVGWATPLLGPAAWIMIHDYHGRSGKSARQQLEGGPFDLVGKCDWGQGVGLFRFHAGVSVGS